MSISVQYPHAWGPGFHILRVFCGKYKDYSPHNVGIWLKRTFTSDCTMDEMIVHCVQFLDEFNKDNKLQFSKEEAIAEMKQYFPTLKRWVTE